MPAPSQQTALLIGASRGLGLGLASEYLGRGWRVIATARDDASKLQALDRNVSGNLRIERLDIADAGGAARARKALADEKLDLLFVIAGISGSVPKPLHEVPPDEAARVYLTNAYFPIAAAEAFASLLQPKGTVALMSSTLTGQPATAIPLERSAEGLPVGAQIIGPYLEDRTTLRFAELAEQEFGGFVAPPGFAG